MNNPNTSDKPSTKESAPESPQAEAAVTETRKEADEIITESEVSGEYNKERLLSFATSVKGLDAFLQELREYVPEAKIFLVENVPGMRRGDKPIGRHQVRLGSPNFSVLLAEWREGRYLRSTGYTADIENERDTLQAFRHAGDVAGALADSLKSRILDDSAPLPGTWKRLQLEKGGEFRKRDERFKRKQEDEKTAEAQMAEKGRKAWEAAWKNSPALEKYERNSVPYNLILAAEDVRNGEDVFVVLDRVFPGRTETNPGGGGGRHYASQAVKFGCVKERERRGLPEDTSFGKVVDQLTADERAQLMIAAAQITGSDFVPF